MVPPTSEQRVIAPVWEANHVWLILVVTILFNAFPPAFARLGVALHVPLALALVGIVLRGSAFVFRAYGPATKRHTHGWGRVFASASVVTPLFFGVTVGAITEGRLGVGGGSFVELYVAPWLTPFAAAVGVFALVLFTYLAAVYLTVEATTPEIAGAFRTRALVTAVGAAVMALVVLLLARETPHVHAALITSRLALPLHATTVGAGAAALALLWTRRYWWARVVAAAQVSLIVWGWGLAPVPVPDQTRSHHLVERRAQAGAGAAACRFSRSGPLSWFPHSSTCFTSSVRHGVSLGDSGGCRVKSAHYHRRPGHGVDSTG